MTPYKKKAFQRSEVEVEENLQEKKISKGPKLKSKRTYKKRKRNPKFKGKVEANLQKRKRHSKVQAEVEATYKRRSPKPTSKPYKKEIQSEVDRKSKLIFEPN